MNANPTSAAVRAARSYFARKGTEAMIRTNRSRGAELYFNGACLLRAFLTGRFRKIPFFLQHLWAALAK